MTKAQIKKIGWTLAIIFGIGCLITAIFWNPMLIALACLSIILTLTAIIICLFRAFKYLIGDWIYDYRLRGCLHSPTDECYYDIWEYDIKRGKFDEIREHLNSAQADNNMHPMAKADRLKLIDRLEKVKYPFKK